MNDPIPVRIFSEEIKGLLVKSYSKLNIKTMATQFFIEPELENLETVETAAEWQEIAESLGLEMQLQKTAASPEKKAPPYQYVDPKTERIIAVLCPCQVEYTKYGASTIPLDILHEIKKCVDNGWYKNIYICYDDKTPDPFVIGAFTENDRWISTFHLIARWGAELLPFEMLEEKAVALLAFDAKESLNELKVKIDYAVNNVTDFVRSSLGGKDIPRMNFFINTLRS